MTPNPRYPTPSLDTLLDYLVIRLRLLHRTGGDPLHPSRYDELLELAHHFGLVEELKRQGAPLPSSWHARSVKGLT